MIGRQILEIIAWAAAPVMLFLIAAGFLPGDSPAIAASEPSGVVSPVSGPTFHPTSTPVIYPRVSLLPQASTRVAVARVESQKWVMYGEDRVRADVVDIHLSRFPRPEQDNGRGLHWFPTTGQKTQVVDRFIPELVTMKIHWLVILQGLEEWDLTANDYLVERLNEAGILPVMRIEARIGALDLERFKNVVAHYRARGVRYFQIYNEPNVRQEWATGDYPTPELFIRHWIPPAEVVAQYGGLPGLAPVSPSPNHADELFIETALQLLKHAGRYDLINVMWLAIHNYGGMDDNGYLRYRRYGSISKMALGQYLPVLATEGGLGDALESSETILSAFRELRDRESWYLAYCPWLIGNSVGGGHDDAWESQAWFQRSGAQPIVGQVKELP